MDRIEIAAFFKSTLLFAIAMALVVWVAAG